VVLAGPPGTGKTTIGRALAHRLKGKFFLIDGTAVAGSYHFYMKLDQVFEAAARNAPSVVFIDDGDLIFEADSGKDFYRYLLTKLDGLESVSADRVCVMITAMDVASLPPALVRSGRIELWLETRLPDEPARQAILSEAFQPAASLMGVADMVSLAAATRGFTAADLKSIVEDAKLLAAHDVAKAEGAGAGAVGSSADDYLWSALGSQRAKRRIYAKRRPAADREPIGFAPEVLELANDW
jgi:SpoVK/Ycf46/Vps4 family AAA+-type ATPase